ncbi:hypothetical protein [Bacillus sp. 2205SS5-2]|uniref:hypothetical protein n=1 Tax=Bacillus sp. 2205SS5-2 TaxID=3109031 RepID=UPI003004AC72
MVKPNHHGLLVLDLSEVSIATVASRFSLLRYARSFSKLIVEECQVLSGAQMRGFVSHELLKFSKKTIAIEETEVLLASLPLWFFFEEEGIIKGTGPRPSFSKVSSDVSISRSGIIQFYMLHQYLIDFHPFIRTLYD